MQTITIKYARHWMDILWDSDKDKLKWMFNQHQFDIEYKKKHNFDNSGRVIISKQS